MVTPTNALSTQEAKSPDSTFFSRVLSQKRNLGIPVPSRVLIGLKEAHQSLSDPKRGVSKEEFEGILPAAGPLLTDKEDIVNALILENITVWNGLMKNDFCQRMSTGTASLDGFRYYMIQDLFYLRNYVRGKFARGLSRGYTQWAELEDVASGIPGDIDFATFQLQTCVNLGVSAEDVEKIEPSKSLTDYLTWQNNFMEENDGEQWIDLHVMVLPCLLGYDQIARTLANSSTCVKDTVYYDQWILGNISPSTEDKYRKFCNDNMRKALDDAPDKDALWKHWSTMFNQACVFETNFFKLGLDSTQITHKENLDLKPGSEYCLRNGLSGAVLDLDTSQIVTNPIVDPSKGNTQRWVLNWDTTGNTSGYTLKNKSNNSYLAGTTSTPPTLTTVTAVTDNAKFFILAFFPGDISTSFHVFLAKDQNYVLDITPASSDPGTKASLSTNKLSSGTPPWNQVWYLDLMG